MLSTHKRATCHLLLVNSSTFLNRRVSKTLICIWRLLPQRNLKEKRQSHLANDSVRYIFFISNIYGIIFRQYLRLEKVTSSRATETDSKGSHYRENLKSKESGRNEKDFTLCPVDDNVETACFGAFVCNNLSMVASKVQFLEDAKLRWRRL